MRLRRLAPRWGPTITMLLALMAASCTNDGESQSDIPDPNVAASALLEAWNEADSETMAELFANDSTMLEAEIERAIRRAPGKNVADGFEVTLTDEVETPSAEDGQEDEDLTAEAVYDIVYDVDGFEEASLEGVLELTFDAETENWSVLEPDNLMFPDVSDGDRLDMKATWPKRGIILARNGTPIARGDGFNRSYPFGSLAGSTIGHLELVTKKSLADASPGREIGDLVGGSGLEGAYEERLAGTPDLLLRVVDKRGRSQLELDEQPGTPSKNVKATLDMRVQRATSNAFGSTVGGAVVLDPSTGDILAAVTSYEIDPNGYVGTTGFEPFNRALSGTYPPGSALKVVTAGAALDTGVVEPSTMLTGPAEYQGVRNFESGAYPSLDFATAVRNSVNTAFAQVALDLGAKRLTRYAELFGFNSEPAMPLDAAEPSFPFPENASDLMWGSIGQAQVLTAPLQMATVAATVANGGRRMEPRASLGDPKQGTRVLKRSAANELAVLMEGAVNSGTGTSARISGVRVAGKTGTAEVDVGGERRNHAWFITFAPIDSPQVAIAVVSEYGGIGGQVAAPIAGNIYTGVLPLT
ncbi:MAG TPA: penicillin-binding transpeptidase domain-containing protein [Actinomycetota bacterium]|nr:penicillin-binding transpeptidase domain-containing protein [Actinomycetota bacterium]